MSGVTEAFAESVDRRRPENRPRGSDETGKNKNKLHVSGDVHVGSPFRPFDRSVSPKASGSIPTADVSSFDVRPIGQQNRF